jgi:branched-chain amino acid transport system ATP-binding protein
MAELLCARGVFAGYGESVVLEDISISLAEGDSLALLGRNGVGKTTLLTTLMGLTRLHGGSIAFAGRDISHLPTHGRAALGLGWVPQERMVFPSLTVAEHLLAVARRGEWTAERVYQMFPRLLERSGNFGNQLSGGEQQMLAIARALVTNPRLLLLDEPMEGLAPLIVLELARAIRTLVKETKLAIIVVEQHAKLALGLTERAVVLDRGRIVYEGPSEKLANDPAALHQLIAVA